MGLSLLLHRNLAALGALTRASVGVRALATDRQSSTVAEATIAAEIHESLDVGLDLAAQITLDHVIGLKDLAYSGHLLLGEFTGSHSAADARLVEHLKRRTASDSIDIGEGDVQALVAREVYTGDTCHEIPDFILS